MSAANATRKIERANCGKCGAIYWYDGCTWCPNCDADEYDVSNPNRPTGILPDAADRVRAMRLKNQDELQARFDREGEGGDPKLLTREIFDSLRLQHPESRSQIGQDLFVLCALGSPRGGYFVEAGACDGVTFSNTYLLEKKLGWRGVLCEPARCFSERLRNNRATASIDDRALWMIDGGVARFKETVDAHLSTFDAFANRDGHAVDRARPGGSDYDVMTVSLAGLLEAHGAPDVVDYLSLDTEGSEPDVLEGYDWKRKIRLITVEHNHVPRRRERILEVLAGRGYLRVCEGFSQFDDWYVSAEVAASW